MSRELSALKILIVHEWLYTWAGAERCLEEVVAIVPHADVLVGIVTPDMRRSNDIAGRAIESWVGRLPGAHRHHRWFLPLHAAAFAGFDTRPYDLVISLSHGFEKTVRARTGAKHVCYTFSPPRYFWDLRDTYMEHGTLLERTALQWFAPPMRALDRLAASRVDRFISISKHVASRVRRCYDRDSDVIYPPVRPAEAQSTTAQPPFLLSIGRLVSYKRVDLAIQAAEALGMPLVVAGDGPERARLERMAGPHTRFVGRVSDTEAARLLASCAAFVFCAEEDFGIAPLEANAYGKPVVACRKGAVTETLEDGVTASFFPEQRVDVVVEAIRRALSMEWNADTLRRNAARFSPDRFRSELSSVLLATVNA